MATVTLSHTYKAPAAKVWNALTRPEEMKKWYFHVRDFELKEGNVYTFYEKEYEGTYLHRCEILRIQPLQLFEHTWEHPSHSEGTSILQWLLEPVDENETTLTITHSGLENLADGGPDFAPENYEFGWKGFMHIFLRNYLYGIEKQVFETDIQAPREKVWKKLWDAESYKEWTSAFIEGSYFEGTFEQGNRVYLLSPSGEGMYSDIIFLKENESLVFSHIGYLKDKKELPLDDETSLWTGSLESYTLTETGNGTHLKVELDNPRKYHEQMAALFPKALSRLKAICEND